ncbi:MAG: UDP-N-acetylmuramate--L-alanine ligase [Bacteroidales bacterium]
MKQQTIYFLGIGGIGMSALAHYFLQSGARVFGYDLTPTAITDTLIEKGAMIHFEEDVAQIPEPIDLVIHTPAVSIQHKEYQYFKENNIPIYKRSQVLGMLSKGISTIAVAGTHGKTTTTSMVAQILYPETGIMAFIGGIAKNFNTNFVISKQAKIVVAEADEYDRSFLTLFPSTAVITSMDADHLDIYGAKKQLAESFQLFANQVKNSLIIHDLIANEIEHPHKVTYGFDSNSDYVADHIRLAPNKALFDIHHQNKIIKDVEITATGEYNILNALAAYAAVKEEFKNNHTITSLTDHFMIHKLLHFNGVKRRFDYQIERDDIIYIDDYAHHPEEIRSFLTAVRNIYPGKEICGIFQPHLYSRTRDFAEQFAEVLALLDQVILMDIYPAREAPIPGITSEYLLSLIPKKNKLILKRENIMPYLSEHKPQVLLTIGAGDIDKLIPEIKKLW